MEWLQTIFNHFTSLFVWWFVLQPWEQGLRVRCGKRIKKFGGGIHFKIPYLDYIFSQNCRLRISGISPQTVTTLDHKTITLAGALQYRVEDVTPLYMHLHMADETISNMVQAMLTEFIAWRTFDQCSPDKLMDFVSENLDLSMYGLTEVRFILSDFAVVKTYRMITGEINRYFGYALQTDKDDSKKDL